MQPHHSGRWQVIHLPKERAGDRASGNTRDKSAGTAPGCVVGFPEKRHGKHRPAMPFGVWFPLMSRKRMQVRDTIPGQAVSSAPLVRNAGIPVRGSRPRSYSPGALFYNAFRHPRERTVSLDAARWLRSRRALARHSVDGPAGGATAATASGRCSGVDRAHTGPVSGAAPGVCCGAVYRREPGAHRPRKRGRSGRVLRSGRATASGGVSA